MNVVVRSSAIQPSLAAAVRDTIRALDPDLPIYNLRTMSRRVDESLARRRFAMLLLTVFAVFAAGLAAIGIYGVIAYLVGQGRREVGIRLALGATPGAIVRMVVGHGLSVAAAGVAAGVAGALVLTRFMRGLLFGIAPSDPLTFGTIVVMLGLVALVASYVPARRAAQLDPMLALRAE